MKKTYSAAICAALLLPSAYACALDSENTVELGLGFTQTSNNQYLTLNTSPAPGVVNQYDSNQWASPAIMLAIGTQKQVKNINQSMALKLGLEGVYIRDSDVSGTVHPLTNVASNFDTLNYSYSVDSFLVLANVVLDKKNVYKDWSAYLKVGAGLGLLYSSDYEEVTPSGSTAVPMTSPFGAHTKSNVAFSAGVGFGHKVSNGSTISVGYRYLNAGEGRLDTTPAQNTQEKLGSRAYGHHMLTLSFAG